MAAPPGLLRWDQAFAWYRGALPAAVVLGLALRLAFGLGYWVDKPLTHDEHEYLTLARNLAAGRGLTYDSALSAGESSPYCCPEAERFGRAPLYPAFLTLAGGGRDEAPTSTPVSVKIAQAIVGAGGVWVLGLLAAQIAGARAGRFAALIAAVYPPLVWICAYALSEALYSTLALLSALLLARALESALRIPRSAFRITRSALRWALAAGLVTGAAILTRPATLFFLGLAVVWLAARRLGGLALALLLGATLVVGPWTIRNVKQYGRFVLVASEGGITFWTGNHPLARGDGDMAANPDLKRANLDLRARHPGLTSEEREPIYYGEAFRHIADRPGRWLGLLARKVFYTWVPIGPSYTLHSTRYVIATLLSYGIVLPFAVAGFVTLIRRRAPALRQGAGQSHALWLLAGSALLANVVFFPQERFRIPVIDPALIICASVWMAGRARAHRAAGPAST